MSTATPHLSRLIMACIDASRAPYTDVTASAGLTTPATLYDLRRGVESATLSAIESLCATLGIGVSVVLPTDPIIITQSAVDGIPPQAPPCTAHAVVGDPAVSGEVERSHDVVARLTQIIVEQAQAGTDQEVIDRATAIAKRVLSRHRIHDAIHRILRVYHGSLVITNRGTATQLVPIAAGASDLVLRKHKVAKKSKRLRGNRQNRARLTRAEMEHMLKTGMRPIDVARKAGVSRQRITTIAAMINLAPRMASRQRRMKQAFQILGAPT